MPSGWPRTRLLLARFPDAPVAYAWALESVNAFRDSPAGHVRITVPRPAAHTIIEPVLSDFLRAYPAVTLEVTIDSTLTDIVRERFDAGIRPGHRVEQDMIALRVGEDAEPTVVASPDYLRRHGTPKEPGGLGAEPLPVARAKRLVPGLLSAAFSNGATFALWRGPRQATDGPA